MAVTLVPASEIDFDALVAAFNSGYEGYILPIEFDADQMRVMIENNHIDLTASWVALDEGEAVGVGLLAKRGTLAWVGGMGVAASHRRQGIGRQLMLKLLESARAHGMNKVQLEVIKGNTAAHQLYLSLGFKNLRRLLVIESSHGVPAIAVDDPVEIVPAVYALQYYIHFHKTPNPWQRHYLALQMMAAQSQGWLAVRDGKPLAYAVGRANDDAITWMDIAAAPGEAGAMESLIGFLHGQHPEATGRMLNLGEDDAAWPVFYNLGYDEILSQYEMQIALE